MEEVFKSIMMDQDMMGTGSKDNGTGKEEKLMLTEMYISVCTMKDSSMGKEIWGGQMDQSTMAIFRLEQFKERVYITGLMVENLMDNGKIIKQMALEHLSGQTVKNILVSL